MFSGKKTALLALLLGVMMVLSLAEGFLPPLVPPFGRIGLPNIVVLYAFTCLGWKEASVLTVLKAGFALLTRGAMAGLLSAGGGFLSLCAVLILYALTGRRATTAALGIAGALAHNIGQLIAFSFIADTNVILFYLPATLIVSVITGFATGTLFRFTFPFLKRIGFLSLCLTLLMTGCSVKETRLAESFDGPFNTVTTVTMYLPEGQSFEDRLEEIKQTSWSLHKLFDIYHTYEGINNVKTINDNAGKAPVEIDPLLMDLLKLGKQAYADTGGAVNIAFGAVLRLWHDARETGIMPSREDLDEAAKHCGIDDLILDEKAGTAYLSDPLMFLDVGAIAKGFAAQYIIEAAGGNTLIDMGGNVVACGKPSDKESWTVRVRDPVTGGVLPDIISLTNGAVVSSGGYVRYAIIDGVTYHHIIDPWSLYPANRYSSVTVIHENSAVADMLTTALFILPREEGERLAERFGAETIYIE